MREGESQGFRKRALSANKAEEIHAVEKKFRKNQPDKPIHKPRDSLFSWNSGFNNFTGFLNWAFLLLSIGGLRLLLENFIKYGIRVDPIQWIYILVQGESSEYPTLMLLLYHIVPASLCLIIEKALSVEIVPNTVGMVAHIVNLVSVILVPMVIIHVKDGFGLVGASTVCTVYSVLFLKLWSYIQVNMWCRTARQNYSKNTLRRQSVSLSVLQNATSKDLRNGRASKEGSSESLNNGLVQYPDNLNLRDLYYYMLAPTLCYELNFARTQRIRKRFLLRRAFEVLAGTQIILAVIQQWMIPSIKNSIVPFGNMHYTVATERLLKLAIPNHLGWLVMFYILFHSWLNLIGELLHFADRDFYADWWNSNNTDDFWRTWNLPVHRWAVRHLYFPMVEMGYRKKTASMVVFFTSAFFHEYMVSVPLKTYKIWAFMGMMGQVPLSVFSRFIEKRYGPHFGNIVVWASIIIGQPLCIMMYYHDYMVIHYGSAIAEYSQV